MLTSLFGDLASRRVADPREAQPAFAETMVLEAPAQAQALPREGDPHVLDVFVAGSPAQAIRQHFASTRTQQGPASAMITLLDPSRLWAPAVVKALSDASGQPVQKLHLRERATLRTLAVLERTTMPRGPGGALKLYHADIRARGAEHDEVATALAERSQLTTVIVGTLAGQGLDLLLRALLWATRAPDWHCPWLVFLLPPGADAVGQHISAQPWPAQVRVAAVPVSLTSASNVWNTVLAAWNLAQAEPTVPAEPDATARALSALARTDGVLACGLADMAQGSLQAVESRSAQADALASVARALVLARLAHATACGDASLPEELLATLGARVQLLRVLHGGQRGVVVLLERPHANLALVRQKLAELERVVT